MARAAVIGQVVSGALLLCAGLLLGACAVHRAEVSGLLALTVGQAEEIMMRQAEKVTDPDQLPIGLLLAQGLQNTFPCDEKH